MTRRPALRSAPAISIPPARPSTASRCQAISCASEAATGGSLGKRGVFCVKNGDSHGPNGDRDLKMEI